MVARNLKEEAAKAKAEAQGKLIIVRPSKLAAEGVTGVVAEGTYEDARPNKFNPAKKDFYIRAENGDLYIINGTHSLEEQMKLIEGEETKIKLEVIYNGKQTTKAGKQVHDFLVKVK